MDLEISIGRWWGERESTQQKRGFIVQRSKFYVPNISSVCFDVDSDDKNTLTEKKLWH
jgi:hypothetical protein